MTPKLEARAFAIWRYAEPRDWNVSYDDIERATGLDARQIGYVINRKGWAGRIRSHSARRGWQAARASLVRRGVDHDINDIPVDVLMR